MLRLQSEVRRSFAKGKLEHFVSFSTTGLVEHLLSLPLIGVLFIDTSVVIFNDYDCVPPIISVSYTHLTLPTNREV